MHQPELMALDLNLLVALDALLEAGSVSGAARRLHRSQPAMSRILGRLREMFDDPLLAPHGRGLAPTPRAQALRGPLTLVLSEVRHLVHPPEPFDPRRAIARFRLLSSDYAQVTLLGSVMSWLEAAAPGVSIEVLPVGRDAIDLLANGGADLLLGPDEMCPPWCERDRLIDDAWVVVRGAGQRLPSTLKTYLAHRHVMVAMEAAFGDPVGVALRSAGERGRTIALTVPDFAGALFVVATSQLVATLPRPVAIAGAKLLPVRVGRLPLRPAAPPVAMIWPRRLDKEPAHVWLRAAVRHSLELAGGDESSR